MTYDSPDDETPPLRLTARRGGLQRAARPPGANAGSVDGHPVGLLCDARRPAQRLVGP